MKSVSVSEVRFSSVNGTSNWPAWTISASPNGA